jgi:hypothetical protein
MGYTNGLNDFALGNGGAGTPEAWDILNNANPAIPSGKIVVAFMSLDEAGGTFTAMEEQTTIAHGGKLGVSTAVAARYLTHTYPQYVIFEGRYTKLTPTGGTTFKVWYLK